MNKLDNRFVDSFNMIRYHFIMTKIDTFISDILDKEEDFREGFEHISPDNPEEVEEEVNEQPEEVTEDSDDIPEPDSDNESSDEEISHKFSDDRSSSIASINYH